MVQHSVVYALTAKVRFPKLVNLLQRLMPDAACLLAFAHRFRCASAICFRPSSVFGPVDIPPWSRQRFLPGSDFALHGVPFRVLAPQIRLWLLAEVRVESLLPEYRRLRCLVSAFRSKTP